MTMPLANVPDGGGPPESDDGRWAAVMRRDQGADQFFRYAVLTTGVYCRPSCAARLPRRENVRFFGTGAEAARAGFRPCKRCRPDEPARAERQAAAVAEACRLMDEAEAPPVLAELAEAVGMSRFHFHRIFKAVTGVTPRAYAAARRRQRLHEGLGRATTVTEAIYDAGFQSSGRFYQRAADELGMKPAGFRAGGRGETIRFALGQCTLGAILVAATRRGVCALLLGDDAEALLRDLQDRFPEAELVGGDGEFEGMVAAAVGAVERPGLGAELPLDLRGTAFQQRVWQALKAIRPGQTASYAQIAERIGAPKSARAVARACAANPVAVAIPCHRVVRNDGGLSGYRWGIERKRALLSRERKP